MSAAPRIDWAKVKELADAYAAKHYPCGVVGHGHLGIHFCSGRTKESAMNTTCRAKALAHVALRRKRKPEQLARFTDNQWASLAEEAEVSPPPSFAEMDDAVAYLRELIEEGTYQQ